MAVYIITGKLGGGKTLTAVHMIRQQLNKGLRVATNLDLYPENFKDKNQRKFEIIRVPDKPSFDDMNQLGLGYFGKYKGEEHNGLLVLDECGTWFNSRNWNAKGRAELIEWMLHARKYRWNMALIIQNIDMLDKQARDALAEHTVWMRRWDKFRIPFIGPLTKLLGYEIRPPKFHRAVVKYGDTQQHPTVDTWTFVGGDLYDLYDTEQAFVESESGNYSMLTPWHLVGRYQTKKSIIEYMNPLIMPIIRILVFYPYVLLRGAFSPPRQRGREWPVQ